MKNISILGSTGSIGTQTLEVVRNNEDMRVVALSAGSNIDLIEKQILEFEPEVACINGKDKALELKKRLEGASVKTEIVEGMEGLIEVATVESANIVVAAIVGMIGIRPVIHAIEAGKDIAFANKETLVTAGHIIMPLVKKKQVHFLPVDSEHSAIFQCLQGRSEGAVEKILITASGGPFRNYDPEDLKRVTIEDALNHPNWSMGRKITTDSATLVNKGLEVIEAKWLFNVDYDDIEVVVQPQSIIHSMVRFKDGAVIAQLGTPDMKLPIQYALTYPERRYLPGERLDFKKISEIKFEDVRRDVFPALDMAIAAGKAGGTMPTVFNAANEAAVSLFLDNKISFTSIVDAIDKCMKTHIIKENPSLDEVLEVEKEVRTKVLELF
ncbi:MAG: 1-deoxy-D-xylulose-5-phosphate reductoisomerase [Lachnospiraceae bacterium]|nr:1-deoxy-D-xylulose-5-phosphate reductoisomerase [Lachnospiraceae bacterium]